MNYISDIALERAKTRLAKVIEGNGDKFVAALANITSFLLSALPGRENELPKAYHDKLTKSLGEAVEELALPGQTMEIDRARIFWVFFHAAVLRLATAYFSKTFTNSDTELQRFLDERLADFSAGDERPRVDYLRTGLPRELLEEFFNELVGRSTGVVASQEARLVSENAKAAGSLQVLEKLNQRTIELEQVLKDQAEKLNFVGLSSAFERMIKATLSELDIPVRWIRITGLLLVVTPLVSMALLAVGFGSHWWEVSGPMVAVELVLFYFFRVLLIRYQSVRAQLLQLQLRYNLCAFVEGYAAFATKTRKSPDDKTLEKFEALVFSGISPDPQKVPSQFDGIDSLTKILKTLTGKE